MPKLFGKTDFKRMRYPVYIILMALPMFYLGKKHYVWFIVDSETRFVLGYHLSPNRNSPQAFTLFDSVKDLGKSNTLVTDRYSAYKVPAKSVLNVNHIRVESFKDGISNNLIECFHKQFKDWYKTKQGFNSYESANNLISMFVFFFNLVVRPYSCTGCWAFIVKEGKTAIFTCSLTSLNYIENGHLMIAPKG